MTSSASSLVAIVFGIAVFAVIVAVGWRSVQNRRILRVQGSHGEETIVVANEDDDISSLVTTTDTVEEAQTSTRTRPVVMHPESSERPEFGLSVEKSEPATHAEAEAAGRDRLSRVVSSTRP